jgi:hypothetical protein
VQCVDELIAEFEASLGQAGGKPPG